MTQLELILRNPKRISVEGMVDEKTKTRDGGYRIVYMGEAVQQFDGTFRCLANVYGALCVVEVSIR